MGTLIYNGIKTPFSYGRTNEGGGGNSLEVPKTVQESKFSFARIEPLPTVFVSSFITTRNTPKFSLGV